MKKTLLAAGAVAIASAVAMWAYAETPSRARPGSGAGIAAFGAPSRGNPGYIEVSALNGGRQTLLIQPTMVNPALYEFTNDMGLRAHGVRVTGINQAGSIILIDPMGVPVCYGASVVDVTTDLPFNLPLGIGDGWLLVADASVANSLVIEFYGEPLATKGSAGDTMVIE